MATQEYLQKNSILIVRFIAIKKFCEDKNMTGVKIYVDKITGKNLQRPEYMKLRRKIKAGDTLIIHD